MCTNSLKLYFVALWAIVFGSTGLAQIPPPVGPGPLIFISRVYVLRQTAPDAVQEREVQLTIGVSGILPGSRYELRGNGIALSLGGPAGLGQGLQYNKTFASSAELNVALPPGTYFAVAIDLPNSPTGQITIPTASAPAFRIVNFSALQAWDGGTLRVDWTQVTAQALYEFSLFRSDGRVISLPGASATGTLTIPGSNSLTTSDITADRGELLNGKLSYLLPFIVGTVGNSVEMTTLEFPIQRAPLPPVITTQPQARSASAGDDVTISVAASGTNLTYQWRKDGAAIAGATNTTLTLRSAQPIDSGSYSVVVANTGGSVTSEAAVLAIAARASAPVIAAAPNALTVTAGAKAAFSIAASGSAPLTYQWLRNGVPIAGATQVTLTLERVRPSDSGQYSVTVTNPVGTITSSAAELKVNRVSRISNLSILTSLGSASDSFTLGFVVNGSLSSDAGGAKPVLIRAVGPSLAPLGVQGALDDPKVELYAGSSLTTANDNWGGDPTLANAFTAAGAFAFANATSRDAAVLARVVTSNNSIKVSGTGSGAVLAELYDGTSADDFEVASPRFANVSVLKQIGSGLTAGFVIDGTEPLRLLVRAIGPTLGGFGVAGTLADPKLDLFSQSSSTTVIASNDNWGAATNATQVAAAAASVGAFALPPDSKDAVLLVTLPPGSYTAQVSGVGNTMGVAIVEVYEVQ